MILRRPSRQEGPSRLDDSVSPIAYAAPGRCEGTTGIRCNIAAAGTAGEPLSLVEKALAAVVQESYVERISPPRWRWLGQGAEGISKPQASRLCGGIDEPTANYLDGPTHLRVRGHLHDRQLARSPGSVPQVHLLFTRASSTRRITGQG